MLQSNQLRDRPPWNAVLNAQGWIHTLQCLFRRSFSQRNTFVQKTNKIVWSISTCGFYVTFFLFLFFFLPILHWVTTVWLLKVLSRSWEIWNVLVSRRPARIYSLGRTGALRRWCFGQPGELPTMDEARWWCLDIFNRPIEWIKSPGQE